MKGSTNSSVGDRVAYHSERQMGSPYRESGKKFSFWSNKSEKHLRSALGQRIWIITSEGATKLRFFLAGYYTPDAITSKNNVRSLEGSGTHLPRRIEITELLWFKELFKEQNNFSYGNFSRIRSALVIDGLRRISAAASRSSTATTSAMQEMREDPKKAGEMLEAVLSTVSRSTRLFAVDLLGRVLANAETHFPDRGRLLCTRTEYDLLLEWSCVYNSPGPGERVLFCLEKRPRVDCGKAPANIQTRPNVSKYFLTT